MAISSNATGLRSGVCTSTTRPTAPYEGQMIYETDTNRVLVWDNAAWVMIADTDEPPGLQLIKTQTIGSAVSTIAVSDVFSATYDNYRIQITNANYSVLCGVRVQMNNSTGSTYSTGNMNIAYTSASITTEVSSNSTLWSIATGQGLTGIVLEIINPFNSVATHMVSQSAADTYVSWRSGRDSSSTSNTGFTISMTGGTVTGGTIAVYGYRK